MKIFKGSVTVLLAGVIAIMSFVKKPEQHWIMIGFFAVWGMFNLIQFTIRLIHKPKKVKSKPDKVERTPKEKKTGNKGFLFFGRRSSDKKDGTHALVTALVNHVNYRISDKLKSVYPEATWAWRETNPVELMTNGGTGRIKTSNTKEYGQADVTIDKYGRISFTMLKAEPLNSAVKTDEPKTTSVVDAAVWYTRTGQKVISTIVAELNTHGHQTMYIKENGDIVTMSGDTETKHDTLKNFPENYIWGELAHVLTNDGLNADVDGNKIKITW